MQRNLSLIGSILMIFGMAAIVLSNSTGTNTKDIRGPETHKANDLSLAGDLIRGQSPDTLNVENTPMSTRTTMTGKESRQAFLDTSEALDKWRAYADIGEHDIRTFYDELEWPLLAFAQQWLYKDGSVAWCEITFSRDDYWIKVHEYGHCIGLAIGGHTSGIMTNPISKFDQSNVDEIQALYPRYEFRLVVSH